MNKNKVARNVLKQAKKRGQAVKYIVVPVPTTRCPCWSQAFQQPDSSWHEKNPTEPMCDERGYLPTEQVSIDGHAFVLPYDAMSRRELQSYNHYIEKLGPVQYNDHLLLSPDLPENTKFLDWGGRSWHVYNPVSVPVGNGIGVWLALVRSE